MSNEESINLPPPSDVERLRVLASLIHRRIVQLEEWRDARILTPELRRELHVLQHLRDTWLFEARDL